MIRTLLILLPLVLSGCFRIQGDFVLYKHVTCPKEKPDKPDGGPGAEKPSDAR